MPMQASFAHIDADADALLPSRFVGTCPGREGSTGLIFWTRGEMAAEEKWLNRLDSVVETAVVPPLVC